MKPGKPVAFGRRGRTLWFGLPGNPVSAMTTFEVFVEAALDLLDGRAVRTPVRARLTAAVRHRPGREMYADARLFSDGNGLLAEPLATRGSHDIRCQAARNALLIVPADAGAAPGRETWWIAFPSGTSRLEEARGRREGQVPPERRRNADRRHH